MKLRELFMNSVNLKQSTVNFEGTEQATREPKMNTAVDFKYNLGQ